MWGFGLGISGTLIAGGTAFKAAVNWANLPLSQEGLEPGELYDNGGLASVVESDERRALIEQHRREVNEQIRRSWQKQ
jgi:hypothetical protein